jgi:hypothetical protein
MRHNCQKRNLLQTLSSITLTVPSSKDCSLDSWTTEVSLLLSSAPLREFQLYSIGGDIEFCRHLPELFVKNIINDHGSRLRKFAVQRLHTSLTAVDLICCGCPQLEQLFIVLHVKDLVLPFPPLLRITNG